MVYVKWENCIRGEGWWEAGRKEKSRNHQEVLDLRLFLSFGLANICSPVFLNTVVMMVYSVEN